VNRAYIDELWDMALSKAVAVLRTHIVSQQLWSSEHTFKVYCTFLSGLCLLRFSPNLCVVFLSWSMFVVTQGFCTDPSLMLQIKNLLMLFCHTLRVSIQPLAINSNTQSWLASCI